MNQEQLSGMWSESVAASPDIQEHPINFVLLTTKKIPGACGHHFVNEYLVNRHKDRGIKAFVQTTAWYMGQVVNQSTKAIDVLPGQYNQVELGCTGFANDSGGFDTEYKRKIVGAEWL